MRHPLDGARAKVDRAKQNIVDLADFCKNFLDKHYRHDLLGEFDSQTSNYFVNYPQVIPPPPAISVRVGEILYLLRTSLDHVVGQLLRIDNPTRSLSGCKFPICADRGKHKAFDCGKVDRISDAAAAEIMKLQPCYGRDEPLKTNPLAVLNTLHNIDKHRLLIVLIGAAGLKKWDVQVTVRGHRGVEVHFPAFGSPIIFNPKGATPLGYIHIVPGNDPAAIEVASVKVKQNFAFHVALADIGTAQPPILIPFLSDLEKLVFRIVRDFGRFFPQR